jgi:hypothetical protein
MMRPFEICCRQILTPESDFLLERIKQAVIAPFAMIGLFMTFPLWFTGWASHLILSPFIFLMDYFANFSSSFIDLNLIHRYPEIEQEREALTLLKNLYQNPRRDRYELLPETQKYLIAARHTYYKLTGWYFKTADQILKHFQDHELTDDLSSMNRGIREAIQSQEAILYAKALKLALQRGDDIRTFKESFPNLYDYFLSQISLEHPFRGENRKELAAQFVEQTPHSPIIQQSLDRMIRQLTLGYRFI